MTHLSERQYAADRYVADLSMRQYAQLTRVSHSHAKRKVLKNRTCQHYFSGGEQETLPKVGRVSTDRSMEAASSANHSKTSASSANHTAQVQVVRITLHKSAKRAKFGNRMCQHYFARGEDQIIPYVGRVSTDRSMEAALLDTTPL